MRTPGGAESILRRMLDLMALIACHEWASLGEVILEGENETFVQRMHDTVSSKVPDSVLSHV